VKAEDSRIDWFIFFGGCGVLLAAILPIVFMPEQSAEWVNRSFEWITQGFGIVYIFTAIFATVFLLWIALGRYGTIVFGAGSRPEYGRFAWASMLFCTGIGGSLIYWGGAEWVYYYVDPPFGIAARSDEAIYWAASYGLFHWGPVGWAIYCLPAVALGCSYHIEGQPSLRLSSACRKVLGKQTDRWGGRSIDLIFVVGLLGTAATGLGLGTSIVSSALSRLTGYGNGMGMQLGIVVVATVLIALSVHQGLDRGIKRLSLVNAALALGFIGFIFLAGPTRFILEMGVYSIGHVVQNFVPMLTWSDPLAKSQFIEKWTVFYWAWWLALGPFVGMFVCKISRGRTVREVIFGMLGWGSLGCSLFFIVLGNYTLFLELNGHFSFVEKVTQDGPSEAIVGAISLLPGGLFWLAYVAVIGLIFIATTYDSAAYTLSAGATRRLAEGEHPTRRHRVFWAFGLGALPLTLLWLGGLRALQTASVLASAPLLVVYGLLAVSTIRMLRDSQKTRDSK